MLKALKGFVVDLGARSKRADIFSRSAQVGFYLIFSIFPFLIFIVSSFGIFLDQSSYYRTALNQYLQQLMPPSAFQLVREILIEVTTNSSSGKVTFGLIASLWSASAGLNALRFALNSAYEFVETRNFIFTRLLSILLTILISVSMTVAIAGVFYGWKLIQIFIESIGFDSPSETSLFIMERIITIGLMFFVFQLIYNILPNRKPFRWYIISPGAILGVALWILMSQGLKLYVQYFNSYNRTYGSIGALIILMLWLYIAALVVIVGGMINSMFETKYGPRVVKLRNILKQE